MGPSFFAVALCSTSGADVDLNGVEFSVLPSGLHVIEEDVMLVPCYCIVIGY